MQAAHTTVVITVPGLGDDIQAIKAGLLEIADVLCVNKSDREGADRTVRDLLQMLELRADGSNKQVEIINAVASRGLADDSGMRELAGAIERHRESAGSGEAGTIRAGRRAAAHVAELVRGLLADRAASAFRASGGLAAVAALVAARRQDPYTAAEAIVATLTTPDPE
jgi:LAO/AO transport system kinase